MTLRIFWDEYKDMKANRPIPFEGMPVYLKGIGWLICSQRTSCLSSSSVQLNSPDGSISGYFLSTYRDIDDSEFILPGEPNCPEITGDLFDAVDKIISFVWRAEFNKEQNRWRIAHMVDFNIKVLPLPSISKFNEEDKKRVQPPGQGNTTYLNLFPNNQGTICTTETSLTAEELKKHNMLPTSTHCIKCGEPLVVPYYPIKFCRTCEG